MINGKQTFLDVDFSKAFTGFTLPGFDVEALLATQRKNLEALTQANQLAAEGVQAAARRQVEIARQTVDEASELLREWSKASAPEERLARGVDLAKQAFEKGVVNARELAELVARANTEAFKVINKRVTEGFDEIRDYTKQRAAR